MSAQPKVETLAQAWPCCRCGKRMPVGTRVVTVETRRAVGMQGGYSLLPTQQPRHWHPGECK